MRNQSEMFNYLKELLTSHTLEVKNNTIIGKRKYIIGDSFSSFIITYLKNNNSVSVRSTSYKGNTMRYNNDDDIICLLGSMASFKNQ